MLQTFRGVLAQSSNHNNRTSRCSNLLQSLGNGVWAGERPPNGILTKTDFQRIKEPPGS